MERGEGQLRWASEYALLLSFREEISAGASHAVHTAMRAIRDASDGAALSGIRDLHPGYCTLLITLDPARANPGRIESEIRRVIGGIGGIDGIDATTAAMTGRSIEIPVCYDVELAPDLADVAAHAGIDPGEVTRLHAAAQYRVCFLGFTPGFPYLMGLPERLATPRLPTPRRRVPAGSVAIGGAQAGIYPFDTPGGWRLIGRTPLRMFDLRRDPPALVAPGDSLRFVPISSREFHSELAR